MRSGGEAQPPRVWHFLLPATGSHEVRAENIGAPGQLIHIDGEAQSSRSALVFAGPENSMLELKQQGGSWVLLVNGTLVEDYRADKRRSGDETLRELKTKPDGSYIISTDFDAAELTLNLVRKFCFSVFGEVHEVHVAHKDCIWQIVYDGMVVDRKAHTLKTNAGEASFTVEIGEGKRVKGEVRMTISKSSERWQYVCTVHGTDVPPFWTKTGGGSHPAMEPAIIPVDLELLLSTEPAGPAPDGASLGLVEPVASRETEMQLPQGVTFDEASGLYHANIRTKLGKFAFLGEFNTPEEAHQRYLEAVPAHCPDKVIAPQVPT